MSRRVAAAILWLSAGALPYLLWRHDALFVTPFAAWLPSITPLPPSPLTDWLLYSFSDGAWYAAMLTIATAFRRTTRAERVMHAIILALPFGLETLQYLHIVPGTADIADALTYTAILIINQTYQQMRKHRISKALLGQVALLVAFAAVAMASSSDKSAQEAYDDGYRIGSAIREAISETAPETLPADSLQITPGAELADNH